MKRKFGRSGIEVSALGMGCWAIGGAFINNGNPNGWGQVNDEESIKGLQRAFELGVDFYDTADMYGSGHSEKIIAKALGDKRDQLFIATKVGFTFNEEAKETTGANGDPDYIRQACDASLRRLNTDYIDLYQLHLGQHPLDEAAAIRDVFEELVKAGKIRAFGWSTDDPTRAAFFAESPHCIAIQQSFSLFGGNEETLAVCEKNDLASILRGPLAMGMLTGKFNSDTKLPDDDIRRGWNFQEGTQAERLKQLDALRDVLTSGGRTLGQGALGWLWAKSEVMIPIPGFKTVKQVEENAGALEFGPLSREQMMQVEQILRRS